MSDEVQSILSSQIFGQKMMENLINDLLDLAKMDNNEFEINKDYFNFSLLVYESLYMVVDQANKSKINLKAEIDSMNNLELIKNILGDRQRYMQILMNFMSNAMKFTDSGGTITVRISVVD